MPFTETNRLSKGSVGQLSSQEVHGGSGGAAEAPSSGRILSQQDKWQLAAFPLTV